MNMIASAGTLVGMTTAAPASRDVAGFSALSFALSDKVGSVAEFGAESELASHKTAVGTTEKDKGGSDEGSTTILLALDTSDVGQMVLATAAGSRTKVTIYIMNPRGDHYFLYGLPMSFKPNFGGSGDVISVNVPFQLIATGKIAAADIPPGATANFMIPENLTIAGAV